LKLGQIPPASSEATRKVMKANRGKNTGLEMRLAQALKAAGLPPGDVQFRIGGTRVDLAFPTQRVAVQVHGCFWHHCPVCNLPLPSTNRSYWKRHFRINRARDKRARIEIRNEGWNLIELWGHEIESDMDNCVQRVAQALQAQNAPLKAAKSESFEPAK
jgi:DNA mismatch endonuclease (patch repair protein)